MTIHRPVRVWQTSVAGVTSGARNAPVEPRRFPRLNFMLKRLGRRALPAPLYDWLRRQWRGPESAPSVGAVGFGNLRRLTPVSQIFGAERGRCVDRYYIENFLARHAADIRGRVLEVANNSYTTQYGGDRVVKSDVLYVEEGNPRATIVADLTAADAISGEFFDCIILTQTLQFIYELRPALATLHRVLKPGGVLLITAPGISQISRYDMDRWGDYWRFTSLSMKRLLGEVFSAPNIEVESHGNVLAAGAFLQGLASEELRREELDYRDANYELLIAARAVKGAANS